MTLIGLDLYIGCGVGGALTPADSFHRCSHSQEHREHRLSSSTAHFVCVERDYALLPIIEVREWLGVGTVVGC